MGFRDRGGSIVSICPTLEYHGYVSGGQTVWFKGTQEVLNLLTPSSFSGSIASFQAGDTVDLVGVTGLSTSIVNGAAVVSGGGVNVTFLGSFGGAWGLRR
jgi:hypothetical protein